MKTDLKKVLSVSGQPGLFNYLSQANAGAIVESMLTKKRTCFGLNARMTSLADISIFTDEGEVKLQEVFEKMKADLGEAEAPSGKADPKVLAAFFARVLPEYDRNRFYVSHMKKVADWYNFLKKYATLDFADEDNSTDPAQENPAH